MAQSDAQTLDALKAARDRVIAGGVAKVTTPGGTAMEFHTLGELESMIATYEDRIAQASGTRFTPVAFFGGGQS